MASPGDKLLRAQADKAFDILAAYSGGIEILVKRFDKKDPDYLRVKAILDNANQEMVDLGLADELEKLQKDGKLYTVLSLSDINSKAFKPSSTTTAKSYRTEIKKNTTSQRRGVRTPTKNASDDESSEDGDFGVDADLETEIDREEKELKGDDEAFEGASDGESTNMAFRGTHDTSNAFVYRNKELAQTVGGIATTNLPSAAILKEFNEFLAVKRAQEAELSSNKQRTAPAGGKVKPKAGTPHKPSTRTQSGRRRTVDDDDGDDAELFVPEVRKKRRRNKKTSEVADDNNTQSTFGTY